MAKPDLNRNTDVPATIAGFYFQIIIACREICKDHVKEVGVETGADIVIIDENREKSYIEAKLHLNNFNCLSNDVVKTIYNFYNDYKSSDSIKQMVFTTNAGIVDKDKTLFNTWGKRNDEEIEYIKKAVLLKSIEVHPECKKNYEKFCSNMTKSSSKKKKEWKKELLEEVFVKKSSYSYTDFAVENNECTYHTFIKKMQFKFWGKQKNEMLEEIEEEAKKKIAKDYQGIVENSGHETLSEQGIKHIFSSLVKIFFDCVVENSQNGTKRNISVAEYKKCLSDYYKNKVESKEADRIKHCLERLAYDEEEFLGELDLEQEKDKKYLKCYSQVKELFLSKLQEEKGDMAFMERYLLKKSMKSQEVEIISAIIELLNMLTVILYEEKVKIEDVKLFFDDDLDNLEIIGKLRCCYKRAYGKNKITNIVRNLLEDLEEQSGNENEQIIVAEANYYTNGRPCDKKELLPEVYNITQTTENYKDYIYLEKINYKCTNCLERDGADYKKFWEGGGGLCKKI